MKLYVCESCEAEFRLKHNMSDKYYVVTYCPFCGDDLSEDLEDEVVWDEEDD